MEIFSHLEKRVSNKDEYTRRTSTNTLELVYQVSDRLSIIIGGKYFLKSGSTITFDEVENMKLIRLETGIPIPNIVDYWIRGTTKFILLEKVEGVNLNSIWDTLDEVSKESIANEVAMYIVEIRKVERDGKVLLHGDLIPLNIMVEEFSKKVTAILDWETCRYGYEEEEIDIMNNNPDCPNDWRILISKALMNIKEAEDPKSDWKCNKCGYNNMTNVVTCQAPGCGAKKPGTV